MARDDPRQTLYSLLLNPLIARHTFPHLSIAALLRLAATSKAFRDLIQEDASAFRLLDLSTAKGAVVDFEPVDRGGFNWRSQRMDEGVTEEDFYCGPLRGIFASLRRRSLLQHVHTLVLDGQAAPAEVLHEVISDDQYNVRILSVVGSTHLNEAKFRQALHYAVRPSRPEGTPRLQGVYVFGAEPRPSLWSSAPSPEMSVSRSWNQRSREALVGSTCTSWYAGPGRVLPPTWSRRSKDLEAWASTLKTCEGIIAFDAVLCYGPKHFIQTEHDESGIHQELFTAAVASVTIDGCNKCGTVPEGPVYPRDAPSSRLPLLAPPPRYTASITRAQRPSLGDRRYLETPLYARCTSCLSTRCCESCFTFWCEDCYDDEALRTQSIRIQTGRLQFDARPTRDTVCDGNALPGDTWPAPKAPGIKRECWECGRLCEDCNGLHRRPCKSCGFPFCGTHFEGSTDTMCDWCQFSRRRGREMH